MNKTNELKRALKAKAHHLKPVIIIGQKGLTQAVQLEIERALIDHELIKIKVNASDKQERQAMVDEICQERGAMLIQIIGSMATIYRESEDNKK